MKLFLSTIVNRVDAKGRVSVPASFRSILKEEGSNGMVCYPSIGNQAIEGCSEQRIERFNELIARLNPFSRERQVLSRAILGQSVQLPFDSEGRVKLPPEFMQQADISDTVSFVGLGEIFQMWNPEIYAEEMQRVQKEAPEFVSALEGMPPKIVGFGE